MLGQPLDNALNRRIIEDDSTEATEPINNVVSRPVEVNLMK